MDFWPQGSIYLIWEIITAIILFLIIKYAVKSAIIDAHKVIKKRELKSTSIENVGDKGNPNQISN
jgi:F0F1-type ATP synthase membrane subunit b/b'